MKTKEILEKKTMKKWVKLQNDLYYGNQKSYKWHQMLSRAILLHPELQFGVSFMSLTEEYQLNLLNLVGWEYGTIKGVYVEEL